MLQAVIDFIGFGLCHQIPERTLTGAGLMVPVCSRDAGIYLGFLVGSAIVLLFDRRRSSQLPPVWLSAVLAVGLFSLVLDGLSAHLGLRSTTNELRLATGLATGFAIAAWVVPLVSGQLWATPGRGRVLDTPLAALVYLAAIPSAYAVTWWVLPLTGPLFALLVVAAILVTFVSVNMVIVGLLPPFERKVVRLRDALPTVGVAFALTVGQLWAASAFKAWALGSLG